MMKKKSIVIVLLLITTYVFGAITVHYKLFPFKEILYYKNKEQFSKMENIPIYEKNHRYLWLNDIYNNAYTTKMAETVMLGDSITYRANWHELLNNDKVVNRGIGADITEGYLNRLDNIIKLKPKQVFIMGGINDIIMDLTVNDIYINYVKIINELKKHNIKPIIQSTLFTTKSFRKNLNDAAKVALLNSKLKIYANEENIVFIDLNKGLSQENYLLTKYSTDGIHLNAEGYNIWRDAILPYIRVESDEETITRSKIVSSLTFK